MRGKATSEKAAPPRSDSRSSPPMLNESEAATTHREEETSLWCLLPMRCDVYPMMIGAYGDDSGPVHTAQPQPHTTILVRSGASARDMVTCQLPIGDSSQGPSLVGAQCQPSRCMVWYAMLARSTQSSLLEEEIHNQLITQLVICTLLFNTCQSTCDEHVGSFCLCG